MSKQLTGDEHKARHVLLHRELDELVGDFIEYTHRLPTQTTLMEFMVWSHEQTLIPTERKD